MSDSSKEKADVCISVTTFRRVSDKHRLEAYAVKKDDLMPLLLCPNDNSSMQTVDRDGVQFDMCPTCRGVWLDRGELEKLMASAQENASTTPAQNRTPSLQQPYYGDHGERGERGERGEYGGDYRGYRKKRSSIFDIFD